MNRFLALIIALVLFSSFGNAQSDMVWDKAKKHLKIFYPEQNIEIIPINIPATTHTQLKQEMNQRMFKIQSDQVSLAYLYLGEGSSMKNLFDYMVLFNTDWTIDKVKILVYREQHGRQIGAPRWLDQFVGMSLDSNPKLGDEIDSISGATISATNMTLCIQYLLADLNLLKSQGII